MRTVTVVIALFLLTSLAVPVLAGDPSTIVTMGTGESTVFPDKAEIQFDLESDGKDSETASSLTAEKYGKVAASLKKLGFGKNDLVTVAFRVVNKYEQDPETKRNVHVGYTARHAIKLTVTDFSKIGSIVDTGLGAGATRLGRIAFSTTKPDEIRDAALENAVKSAHRKAEIMATTVGGNLGKLIKMETGRMGRGVQEDVLSAAPARSAPTTIIPDIIRVQVYVTATWEYLPPGE